jgi:hypothetical protein
MTYELTNEEKLQIVDQHLKSLEFSLYGLELDLIQAQAATPVDSAQVTSVNDSISKIEAKKDAVLVERTKLV